VEGELPPRKSPVIPGHQVVGTVEKCGEGARRFPAGARVGIAWLHSSDQTCEYCRAGMENLCDHPEFTGYTVDGGYAEYAVAREDFVYEIPENFDDQQAAPLLCAGIIGFRCLRISGIKRADASGCTASVRRGTWLFKWRGTGEPKSTPARAAQNIRNWRAN
jgi:propanol-preferring alcohol dehydrogenase